MANPGQTTKVIFQVLHGSAFPFLLYCIVPGNAVKHFRYLSGRSTFLARAPERISVIATSISAGWQPDIGQMLVLALFNKAVLYKRFNSSLVSHQVVKLLATHASDLLFGQVEVFHERYFKIGPVVNAVDFVVSLNPRVVITCEVIHSAAGRVVVIFHFHLA